MFEERVNSVRICEDEPEYSIRIAVFENFVKFFPHVIARNSIVWETYIVKFRFFSGGGGVGFRAKGFVEESSNVSLYQVKREFIVLKIFSKEF